jgi:hypothetical protein
MSVVQRDNNYGHNNVVPRVTKVHISVLFTEITVKDTIVLFREITTIKITVF